MGANAGRNRFEAIDIASYFRDSGGADLTSDTINTAHYLTLNDLNAYWNENGDFGLNEEFAVVVNVTKADAGGTNAYTLQLITDTVVTFDAAPIVIVTRAVATAATGLYVLSVTRELIKQLDPDAKYMTVKALVSGNGTPKFNYWAYPAPFHSR